MENLFHNMRKIKRQVLEKIFGILLLERLELLGIILEKLNFVMALIMGN